MLLSGAVLALCAAGASAAFMNGGPGNDRLIGTDTSELIRARAGNDIVLARGGPDTVVGGAGRDRLFGQRGNDRLSGNAGNDRIDGGRDSDRLFGGPGNDLLLGRAGRDVLSGGKGRDRLLGGSGNDLLNGGSGRDRLEGGPGNDRLLGARGFDLLLGGPGDDQVNGGADNDTVNGLGGRDLVVGGGGFDLLLGGADRDQIRARDRRRDAINCGPGGDIVVADFFERVINDCERILRPPATAALPQDATGTAFGGVQVRINSVATNANAIVQAADPGNAPPPIGRQYHLINVSVLNGSSISRELSFSALGAAGVPEPSFNKAARCGVIPNALPQRPLASGEAVQGNVCWSIETRDIGRLVLLVDDRSVPRANGIAFRMG